MDIHPYEKNAKKHPKSQLIALARIVKEVGWRQPVVVKQSNVIVVGHGRYEAYKAFGDEMSLKELWVIDDAGKTIMGEPESTPLTLEQESTYRLADNKLNESEWDMNMVMEELKLLPGDMLDLTGFGSYLLNLGDIGDFDVDLDRLGLLEIQPPETPRLKDRAFVQFDTIENYKKVKQWIKKNNSGEILEAILKIIS